VGILLVYAVGNCGKMADWIWMPFGVMSGFGQGMGVLDGVHILKRKGRFSPLVWMVFLYIF